MKLKTFFKSILFCFLTALFAWSCGGTHGGIINYCYKVNHKALDSAIKKVLLENNQLGRDTSDNGGYNSGDYFQVHVTKPDGSYSYSFRYYGDSTMWSQDSLNSCMFIWAMYSPKNKGGWSKDFGIFNNSLKKNLLRIIDAEMVSKIDSILGVQHTVD
jgi:hypothetical protein